MSDISTRTTTATRVHHLDRLAQQLRNRNFRAEHVTTKAGTPALQVTNPAVPGGMLAERVLCCHDTDGSVGLYFSWGVLIAGADQSLLAADEIARVLAAPNPSASGPHTSRVALPRDPRLAD